MPHKQADTSQTQTANSLQRTNCYAWSAWTTANWVEFISQARKAGDVQKFCLKHGISRNAYYTRFKKLLPDHPEWLQKRRQKLRAKQLPFLKSIPALPTPKVGVEVLPELWQTEKHLYKPFKPGPNEPTIEVLRQLLLNLPGVDNCSDLATGKAILRAELDGKHAAALGSDFIPALCLDYFPSDTELKAVLANFCMKAVQNSCRLSIIACRAEQGAMVRSFLDAVSSCRIVLLLPDDLRRGSGIEYSLTSLAELVLRKDERN